MSEIGKMDRNFAVKTAASENIYYRDILFDCFSLSGYGWSRTQRELCRLPVDKLELFNENIRNIAWYATGGMAKFITDSPVVSIKAELKYGTDMSQLPRSATSGFDAYIGEGFKRRFSGMIMPGKDCREYEGAIYSQDREKKDREWLINFPLYEGINKLLIGIAEGCTIKKAPPFAVPKPIVFYGSSITQGGCASRPGTTYVNYLSRLLDAAVINLGFAGNAKGEPQMAELISELDMSAFVLDYEHNAPNIEHLKNTHQRFFRIIRDANPQLPVIIISKPDFFNREGEILSRKVIHKTYEDAVNSGDKNVYFIDGQTLFGFEDWDECTIDRCHPTDLGFWRMAQGVYPVLKKVLIGDSSR